MLTVFCSHLQYLAETPFHGLYSLIDNGRFGVNFFLVLSGFVLALSYGERLSDRSVSRDTAFVKKRIAKIYIPYLATMILAIPWYIYNTVLGEGALDISLMVCRLIINICMVQSVIPFLKYSASINGVSWFISSIFIIYLFAPGILRLNNKAAKHDTLMKQVFLTLAVLAAYCCVYMAIRQIEYVRFADHSLSIIYISPLIRVFPFLLGIVACNIYRLPGDFRIKNGSFVEMSGMAVFLLWWISANDTPLPTVVTECADMLVSVLVVLIFAFSRTGVVSGLLGRKKMLALGGISLEFYLVHYPVISYGMLAAAHFDLDKGIAVLPLTLVFLALSLWGARLIHTLSERLLAAFRREKQRSTAAAP